MIRNRPQSAPRTFRLSTDYVRTDLHYGTEMHYRPEIPLFMTWNSRHQPPGAPVAAAASAQRMPDLANAMKQDPDLKVMLNGGYFDLATPFFEGMYEMAHLPMPRKLQANIEYHYYESGHMVYAHLPALKSCTITSQRSSRTRSTSRPTRNRTSGNRERCSRCGHSIGHHSRIRAAGLAGRRLHQRYCENEANGLPARGAVSCHRRSCSPAQTDPAEEPPRVRNGTRERVHAANREEHADR